MIDSPAEYRRKMNEPWPEPVITDEMEREFEYWVGSSYEEHLDDSGQRNFCKDINIGDDMCTKVRDGHVIHPRGLNSLLSGDSGVTFGAI